MAGILRRFPGASIALLVLVLLAPFTSKPFHIDDPLFVWAGQALARDPFHPYLVPVHWFETSQPMFEVMFNPPAVPYYVALVSNLFGAGESTLHLAFLLPALLFVVGTYRLAGRWCRHPSLAALAAALSPGFLVSATNIMADVWAAALFTWSVLLWVEGVDRASVRRIFWGGLIAAACILSKYVGLATLPILAVYALGRRAPLRAWLPALLVPIAVWGGYEVVMHQQIGAWPLEIAGRASGRAASRSVVDVALLVLAALGGTALAPVGLLGLSLRRRALWIASAIALVTVSIGIWLRWGSLQDPGENVGSPWVIGIELALFAGVGLAALLRVAAGLRRARAWEDVALGAWILGILLFASLLNWSVNARALLPALPALAITACRIFETAVPKPTLSSYRVAAAILALSMAVGLELNVADQAIANSARRAGESLVQEQRSAGRSVWFQGHWGFQYYAQRAGAKPMERGSALVKRGDRVLVPMLNTNVFGLPRNEYRVVRVERHELRTPITTLSPAGNAGFYGSTLGILPYGYGFRESAAFWILERE